MLSEGESCGKLFCNVFKSKTNEVIQATVLTLPSLVNA